MLAAHFMFEAVGRGKNLKSRMHGIQLKVSTPMEAAILASMMASKRIKLVKDDDGHFCVVVPNGDEFDGFDARNPKTQLDADNKWLDPTKAEEAPKAAAGLQS